MKIFVLLSAITLFHFAFVREDVNLMHVAASWNEAQIASAEPISKIRLDHAGMNDYAGNFIKYSNKSLDTTMFSQIIDKASSLDTNTWRDDELKYLLVVKARDENISKKYLFEKLKLSGKRRIKFYTSKINRYNSTDPSARNISYYSRPVYDNSGKYAIVQWSSVHGEMFGVGGIKLYHLEDNVWVEEGVISGWKY